MLKNVKAIKGLGCVELVRAGEVLEKLPLIQAEDSHRSFILATWVRSGAPLARRMGIPTSVYLKHEPEAAERLWKGCKVLVDPEDSFVVLAWVCGGPGKLYHVYVTPDFRKLGVATALIEDVCQSKSLEIPRPWPYQTPKGWQWNPYLLNPAK